MSRPTVSEAIYRALLRLYPKDFRYSYGREMMWLFRDRLTADASSRRFLSRTVARSRAWCFMLRDLTWSLVDEHRAAWNDRLARRNITPPSRRSVRGPKYERPAAFCSEMLQDARYAVRQLLRRPLFTALVLITLAVGVGANTAVFSVLRAVVLRPLPYSGARSIVFVYAAGPDGGTGPMSGPDFLDFRELNRSFSDLAAFTSGAVTLSGGGDPEQLVGAQISANMLAVYGAAPVLGRPFAESEQASGASRPVILSDGFWKRRFGGDLSVLGRDIVLNDNSHTIVGVLRPAFNVPAPWSSYDVLRPLPVTSLRQQRGWGRFWVVGRLAHGQTVQTATADLDRIANLLAEQHPETNSGKGVRVTPLKRALVGDTSGPLIMLLGAAGVVLLTVCANIAGLLTARGRSRQVEVAIRSALGAGRARLFRQLLTESILLALLGGALGVALAHVAVAFFGAVLSTTLPRFDEVGIDSWVLAFTATISLGTGIAVGLIPGLTNSTVDVGRVLREGTTKASGPRRGMARGALVVTQVALTVLLANGAAVMLKSYLHLTNVDQGFDPRNVLTMSITPQGPRYEEPEQRLAFYRATIRRIESLPGILHVSATSKLPLEGGSNTKVMVQGREAEFDEAREPLIELARVFPSYITTMDIPLVAGRDLLVEDFAVEAPGIVINSEMARRLWPNENPLGARVSWEIEDPHWLTVVGVVGDTRQWGVEHEPVPEMLVPYSVLPRPRMFLTVRTRTDPLVHVDAIKREINAVDAGLPVSAIRTMEQVLERSVAGRRFNTFLALTFAAIALILITAGIYGVVSYHTAERTREIGIRMALGATGGCVVGEVLLRGLSLTCLGTLLGLGAVFASSRITASMLYGVSPTDPVMLGAGTLLILFLATVASLIPAKKAARVNPVTALRMEL